MIPMAETFYFDSTINIISFDCLMLSNTLKHIAIATAHNDPNLH